MAFESENIWEMVMNETETEDSTMAVAVTEVAKSEDPGSKTVITDAEEDKPEEAAVRLNNRGYRILEIVRNFGVRGSKKEEVVASENQAPAAGNEAKKQTSASADAKTKGTGLDPGASAKRLEDL